MLCVFHASQSFNSHQVCCTKHGPQWQSCREFTFTLLSYTLHFCHCFSFLFISVLLTLITLLSAIAHSFSPLLTLTLCLPILTSVPIPLPPRKSVGLSASSLSPHHTDPITQSQRPLSDQLSGRIQVLRRPFRLPEARQVPGGHCLLRGRERAGQGEDRERGQEGGGNLQCDVHPHIRQVFLLFEFCLYLLKLINYVRVFCEVIMHAFMKCEVFI